MEALEARELLVAQPLLFTLDPAQSSLTVSGHLTTSATGPQEFPIVEQGTDALTSTYAGTINTSFDPISPARLQFVQSGTAADATVTGSWQPGAGGAAGSAAADYGLRSHFSVIFLPATADVAVRNLVAAISTVGLASLSGGPADFTFPSNQTVFITGGRADYRVSKEFSDSGSESLVGLLGTNTSPTVGQLHDLGEGQYRLVVPVRVTITQTFVSDLDATVTFTFTGTLVGHATRPVVDLNGPPPGFDFTTSGAGGAPVNIAAPTATITRAKPADLIGATITLVNRPDGASEMLEVAGLPDDFTSSYTPATGVLRITGTGPIEVYEEILRNVTYRNQAGFPTTGNRTVTVIVRDALNESQIRTTTITVVPALTFTAIDDDSGQRSQVRSLRIGFSTAVTIQPGAFTLTRLGEDGGDVDVGFTQSGDLRTATISFTGSGPVYQLADGSFALTDGNYRLTIDGSLLTAVGSGLEVDADGDGTPGGAGTFDFFRLFGDSDGDRDVDDDDLFLFEKTFGLTAADAGFLSLFDADGDGDVDDDDRTEFDARHGSTLPPAS